MKNLKVNRIIRTALKTRRRPSHAVFVNDCDAYYIADGEFCTVHQGLETVLTPGNYEEVLGMEYLNFESKVWFATSTSFLFYCPRSEDTVEVALDAQLQCAMWNPTKETVAVVTQNNDVALYTIDYENNCARCLEKSNLNADVPQTVYVGWGSAQTQFRGSEGKLKNEKRAEVKTIEDRVPRITWRGNGEMFAVNYWKEGRRTFKVFDFNCKPLYECEETVGLQNCIAWRPEGNMIAVAVCVDNKHSVFVFEKNGYKRFEFALVYDALEVVEMKWSPGGEILGVLQKKDEAQYSLGLYTSSNYKWFLKQHLNFTGLVSFEWSSNFVLQVVTQQEILQYDFKMIYNVNGDSVAVIDGKSLHLTCFKDSCVPPPLAQATFTAQDAINCVVYSKEAIFVIDFKLNISVLSYQNHLLSNFQIQTEGFYYNFHWFCGQLFCLSSTADSVVLVALTNDGAVDVFEQVDVATSDVQTVSNARLFQQKNTIFIKKDHELVSCVTLPAPALNTQHCFVDGQSHIFTQTISNGFFKNETFMSNDVTSFLLFDSYLLFTTNNSLHCVRLQSNSQDFSRPIEQGARLICAIADTSTVVLQIPRGNLEIISCRLIAIDILEKLLNSGDWKKALHFARTDRLNYNLFVDLNPGRFLKNVDKFVEACETSATLGGFIQDLEEGSVLETIYKNCSKSAPKKLSNKRSIVCGALLAYFEEVDYANYMTPIIMIAVYHFDVEKALVYIQGLLGRPDVENTVTTAIKTLIVHTKGEDLFKISLRLYDTNLTRHVCSFTQMDPKTYLPFLNNLDVLPEIKKRYSINAYLNRPELAIRYLLRDEVAPSIVLEFLKSHPHVISVAYTHITKTSPLFREISCLYAKDLSSRKLHDEAALVYKRARVWEEAFEEFRLALDWCEAFNVLEKFEREPLERHRAMERIAGDLVREGRFEDAARIHEEFLNDYEGGVKVLVKGLRFRRALFVADRHKREDIILHDIVPALDEHCADLEKSLSERQKNFRDYKERFLKLKTTDDSIPHEEQTFSKDLDLYSDAGSQITRSSTRSSSSTKSSRSRRKEERKKQDLRVGGVYEDIALIRALHTLIEDTFKMGNDLRELCLVLVTLDFVEEARHLHEMLRGLQGEMKNGCEEIWAEPSPNFDVLDEKYKKPPAIDATWTLQLFV